MRRTGPCLAALVLLALSGSALAQTDEQPAAPPLTCGCPSGLKRGDISVTTAYQRTNVTKHFYSHGEAIDRGHIRGDSILLALDYALTDRLVANVGVPYVLTSYHGAFPHQLSVVDDGATHGTYQDYRADLRYQFVVRQTAVTPFVGFTTPTHNYHAHGHAASGHDLNEQTAGINIERNIERFVPGTYVQGRYAFSLAEKVLGISHNRSNLDVSVGYFITPSLSVRGLWSLQKTYGGLEIDLAHPLTGQQFLHHDQVSRNDYVAVGIGASYSLNETVDLFFAGQQMLHGRNGHKLDFSPTFGITWSFSALRANSCAIN
jgi:hypothetical protein